MRGVWLGISLMPFSHPTPQIGNLIFHNDRRMTWQWHRNLDGEKILRDEVTICNTAKGLAAGCGRRAGDNAGTSKLDKMNPARGGPSWRRRQQQRQAAAPKMRITA